LRHSVPDLLSALVDRDVEDLREDEEEEIIHANRDEYFVASPVERLVVRTINLVGFSHLFMMLNPRKILH
jgi:hypothetical protein